MRYANLSRRKSADGAWPLRRADGEQWHELDSVEQIVSADDLRTIITYCPDTGELRWLHRDRKWFNSTNSWSAWNGRYALQAALTAVDLKGYLNGSLLNRRVRAHRVAWALVHGEWPQGDIDHINGDRADNRIVNLRDVSHGENTKNAARSRNSSTGSTGVSFHRGMGKCRAHIGDSGRKIHIGYFDNIDDAIAARRAAEVTCGFHPNHGRDPKHASEALPPAASCDPVRDVEAVAGTRRRRPKRMVVS